MEPMDITMDNAREHFTEKEFAQVMLQTLFVSEEVRVSNVTKSVYGEGSDTIVLTVPPLRSCTL